MKKILGVALLAAFAFAVSAGQAAPMKKHYRTAHRVHAPRPVEPAFDITRGNAALGGNSASSAFGSNSAGENANGRTGGGFGGN